MTYANIHLRRSEGGVEQFPDLDRARRAARDGDVIVKAHRGGHVEYEAAVSRSDGLAFVDQPPGWKPRMPVYRGATGESIVFDRAAEFYDRTRSISDEAMARTVELLGAELRDRGRVLEVGAGTGLLTIPLHGAGVDVVALDLSAPMLSKLVEKAGRASRLPVVEADATRMPFGPDAFGGAYLRWVLHLVQDWRAVLREVVRVVRPSGVFVANLGAYGGARQEIQERFAEIAAISIEPVGLTWAGFDELDAEMASHGATLRLLPEVREGRAGTLVEFLDGIDENLYSWTWPVPEDFRRRAAAEVRAWAEERFGPLGEPDSYEHATSWRAYDLP